MFLIQEIGSRGLTGMAELIRKDDIAEAVRDVTQGADKNIAVEFSKYNTAIIDTPSGYCFLVYPVDWDTNGYGVILNKIKN